MKDGTVAITKARAKVVPLRYEMPEDENSVPSTMDMAKIHGKVASLIIISDMDNRSIPIPITTPGNIDNIRIIKEYFNRL